MKEYKHDCTNSGCTKNTGLQKGKIQVRGLDHKCTLDEPRVVTDNEIGTWYCLDEVRYEDLT